MISKISLQMLLPQVFRGMEQDSSIKRSQVWLNDVELTRGCRLCITAESGSGKTSLLSFIYGNRKDYDGHIAFDDVDISNNSINRWCELRTTGLALLPQEMRLFPELTVLQNINIKNNLTGHKSSDEINAMLDALGLSAKKNVSVGTLSIGQQQRVALIRTLCQPFDFIFLDEPVSHLDEQNNRKIAEMVDAEARRNNAGIISTSVGHNLLLNGATFLNL